MFINNLIAGSAGQATDFYPVSIDQSLRFNDDDSTYLSRTGTAGDSRTWTFSFWMKPSSVATGQVIFGAGPNASNLTRIDYRADKRFQIFNSASGVANGSLVFDPYRFRDPSAWYHFVFVVNTPASETDRYQFYVNGERLTGISSTPGENTYPSVSATTQVNTAVSHEIGRRIISNSEYFDGYMAEVHFTDGTAYDADAFGELKSGVWVAKTPSVTYGTNGFYLDFANSADIGNDVSGEGNDWTPNNFTASDVVLDSPTDNFATLNPINPEGDAPLSDGNLVVGSTTDNYALGTILIPSTGKWYFEGTVEQVSLVAIGIQMADAQVADGAISRDENIVYGSNGRLYGPNDTNVAYGSSYIVNAVIGVAVNMDDGEITFYEDNVSQGTLDSTDFGYDIRDYDWVAKYGCYNANGRWRANFGQSGFTHTPPTGYLALSTANLPEPTISPADDASPVDYFGTLLWSGDDNATRTVAVGQSGITGDVNFTPDFTWVKRRNGATNGSDHMLLDAVRGVGTFNALVSNGPSPDGTRQEGRTQAGSLWTNFGDIDSFTTDGFVVQKGSDPSHTLEGINQTGGTYVGWNWRLGGAPTVDNSAGVGAVPTAGSVKVDGSNYGSALAGSIAATRLSANTTSGCSIVTYTGTGSDGTIAHGLSQAPEMLVFRRRDADGTDHLVYHSALGAGKNLRHNNTDAENTNTDFFQNTEPTSSVFSIGGSALNTSGRTFVVYCFHSVDEFSKYGSYTGNGLADGAFVYTGFRPAFCMWKRTDASGAMWMMFDAERNTYNVMDDYFQANAINVEASFNFVDFLSNGFKHRHNSTHNNASGGTYIYMAFAENPFKYSNAR